MKSLPTRSPNRSNPSPPASMRHRSPAFRRGRSPDRRRRIEPQGGGEGGSGRMSPPRSRYRREFKSSPRSQPPPDFPIPQGSRSPIRESKRRSFSPKRKSPPRKRERRESDRERPPQPMPRKRSRSKSPSVSRPPMRESVSRMRSYSTHSEVPSQGRVFDGPDTYNPEPVLEVGHSGRSTSDRFQGPGHSSYDNCSSFTGPDVPKFENIQVGIRRNLPMPKSQLVKREIGDPSKVTVVRRPDTSHGREYMDERAQVPRNRYSNDHRSSSNTRRNHSPWEQEEANHFNQRRSKSEGSRPLFDRPEIIEGNERGKYESEPSSYEHRTIPTEEKRFVAIVRNSPQTQTPAPRYGSPSPYVSGPSQSSYLVGREHTSPPREYGRPRECERGHTMSGFEPHEKNREEHFERHDDLRHELELRRRDESRYSGHGESMRSYEKGREYRGDSDRGSSDLRMRINEKRTDRHDRDSGHHHVTDRREIMERDHDRRAMMQPSPPGSDRRRGPGDGNFGHMGEPDRKMRGEGRMPSGSHGPSGNRRNEMPERFQDPSEFGDPRTGRFHGAKPWEVNPEFVPKGRAYFEHDNRDEMMRLPNRGRGAMGIRGHMRGRGMMRGRPYRGTGPNRGFMGGRGAGRRGGYSPRGFYYRY